MFGFQRIIPRNTLWYLKNGGKILIVFFILLSLFPYDTFAVPPPDFIIQAVSQLTTFFTISFAFLSSIFFVGRHVFMAYFRTHRIVVYILIFGLIGAVSFIVAYISEDYYQKKANLQNLENWSKSIELQQNKQEVIASGSVQVYSDTGTKSESGIQSIIGNIIPYEVSGMVSFQTGSKFPEGEKLFITNTELRDAFKNASGTYVVLDAREDLEYDLGHIPGSVHIRFADLKNGKWNQLPKDTPIYVLCWSGMRGKDVTLFLRSMGVHARFLEKGANSWVSFGGLWAGEINFSKVYGKQSYKKVFSTIQAKKNLGEGTLFIDVRSQDKYNRRHIDTSIHIPFIDIPSEEIEIQYSPIAGGKKIITVCDEYINCFYAKIVGIELGKRGANFLGIYNKPWEFK